jgi:regulator of sirC expression with transglutaminase-like and TPR domain
MDAMSVATSALAPQAVAPWWHREFHHAVDADPPDLLGAAHVLAAHRSALVVAGDGAMSSRREIDRLIDGVVTIDEWRTRLFVDVGFTGNGADYHDVRNSFLPDVLARRLGIPITLAVVGQLVAEAAGLTAWGIGLPGHFLLGVAPGGSPSGQWGAPGARIVDPFTGGRTMERGDIESLFASMYGPTARFDPAMLAPSPPDQMLVRMLANLKANYARERDLDGLTAVIRMRTCIPDWSLDEGRELVRLLAAEGSLDEASGVLDQLDVRFPEADDVLAAERARLATSLN